MEEKVEREGSPVQEASRQPPDLLAWLEQRQLAGARRVTVQIRREATRKVHGRARRTHLSVFNRGPPGKVQLERRDKVALLRGGRLEVSSAPESVPVKWALERVGDSRRRC